MKWPRETGYWSVLRVVILVLSMSSALSGPGPASAQSGTATSSVTPSDATPSVGEQVVVTINIDVSDVDDPDDALGSFTGSLDWDPAVLAYDSDSDILAGFTGFVNASQASSGHIVFNGARAAGATGDVIVLTITFDVAGAAGTYSDLELSYSAMAAATTFTDLLPILTVTDGRVDVLPPDYTLTIAANPVGGGTTNPAVGDHTYADGTVVNVTAIAATGYTFGSWSGACTGTGACQVTMDAATSVTANFTLNTYTLTVNKTGTGSGTVTSSPAAIDCGATCAASFDYGTEVTLTAAAAPGSTFTGWSGGGCSGTDTCVVTVDGATSVTANFTLGIYTLTVNKTGTGSGTVTSSPAGIDCGTSCSLGFDYGTEVTLTAAAAPGSTFTGWSGSGCTGTGTCVVTVDGAKSVTANFTKVTYLVHLPLLFRNY